jgi:prepilin-type N-terminal cleavage/methylation domain-containing protein
VLVPVCVPQTQRRGFTVVELAVVVAIIAVVAALVATSVARLRPRANLASAAAEVQALVHGARMSAVSSGRDVAVLLYPDQAGPSGSRGLFIVYEDGNYDFFSAAATVNYAGYVAASNLAGSQSQILATYYLPAEVTFADAAFASTALPAPLDRVVVNACGFCSTGAARAGAIRFDARGRATFHDPSGVRTVSDGGAFTLVSSVAGESKVIAVTASTGTVRLVNRN